MKQDYSLIRNRKRYFVPLYTKCNYDCIHCSAGDKKNSKVKINLDSIRKDIIQAKTKGCDEIDIGGTEPTLYPRLLDIVTFVNELEMDVGICSNGARFSNPGYTKLFRAADVFKIKISFHSHERHIFDFITGTKGSYDSAEKAIKNIIKYLGVFPKNKKRWLFAGVVINSLNYEHLDAVIAHLHSLGVKCISMAYITVSGKAKENSFLFVDLNKIKPHLSRAVSAAEKLKMIYVLEKMPICILKSKATKFTKYDDNTSSGIKMEFCLGCRYNDSCWGVSSGHFLAGGKRI